MSIDPNQSRARSRATISKATQGGLLALLALQIGLLTFESPVLRWLDLESAGGNARSPPLAELAVKHNDVKLQESGDLHWSDAEVRQSLRHGHSLLTLEDSTAELAFLDGTGIRVDPNSLISVERSDAREGGSSTLRIRLLRGGLHKTAPRGRSEILRTPGAEMTPAFEISVGNSVAVVDAASMVSVVANRQDPDLGGTIQVLEGTVEVWNDHSARRVSGGEEVRIPPASSTGEVETHASPFVLIRPAAGETIDPSSETVFIWRRPAGEGSSAAMDLEVSPDPQFRGPVTRTRVPASHPPLESATVRMAVPTDGSPLRYWRVRLSDGSRTSATRLLTVSRSEGPAPTRWLDRQLLSEGQRTTLAWDVSDRAVSYEIETRSGDQRPRITGTAATHVSHGPLEPGRHVWKVRAKLPDGAWTDWGPAGTIEVRDGSAPPPPDRLEDAEIEAIDESPKPSSAVDTRGWLAGIAAWMSAPAYASEQAYRVKLKWKAAPGASRYKVQVARRADFSQLTTEFETSNPNGSWTYRRGMENSKGRLFYRVASISTDGKVGAFSSPKPIPIPPSILGLGGAPEVFSATEAVEAAAQGVLEEASGGADAAKAVESRFPLLDTHAATQAPPLAPEPSVAPKPPGTLAAGPTVVQAPPPTPVASGTWSWNASVPMGLFASKQSSSESQLTTVTTGAHFRQGLFLGATHLREERAGELTVEIARWTIEARLGAERYTAPSTPRTTLQPNVTAYEVSGTAYRQGRIALQEGSPWAWGATLLRSYRWVKIGRQSVEPVGALSLGPAVLGSFRISEAGFQLPESVSVSLRLPLTGIVAPGAWGGESTFTADWPLRRWRAASVSIRLGLELSYLRWASPTSTSLFNWGAWVAPSLSLN